MSRDLKEVRNELEESEVRASQAEGRARAKTLRLNGTQCGHRFEESQRLGRSHGERNSRKKREPRPDPIVLCRTWHRLE